jgi:hypothetical protein
MFPAWKPDMVSCDCKDMPCYHMNACEISGVSRKPGLIPAPQETDNPFPAAIDHKRSGVTSSAKWLFGSHDRPLHCLQRLAVLIVTYATLHAVYNCLC